MLSLGTEDFLAFWIASNSVGLPSGSPLPVRAATSTFLISLANSLPRLASLAAFWCLVVAHLEWPLTASIHPRRRGDRCPVTHRSFARKPGVRTSHAAASARRSAGDRPHRSGRVDRRPGRRADRRRPDERG